MTCDHEWEDVFDASWGIYQKCKHCHAESYAFADQLETVAEYRRGIPSEERAEMSAAKVETAWSVSGALMYDHGGRVSYIPKDAIPAVLRALIAQAGGVEVDIIRDDIACGLVVDLPADALGHRPQWDGDDSVLVRDVDRKRFLLLPMEGEAE